MVLHSQNLHWLIAFCLAAACIEDGRLAELKTVFISRRNTVNAKDLRYLMTLCQEKGIKCRI